MVSRIIHQYTGHHSLLQGFVEDAVDILDGLRRKGLVVLVPGVEGVVVPLELHR
ncbi:MAG: hypothetical protein Q4C76_02805 [Bacillota bacterium]|nr:hypothetical protein [Bacillota bacterium]